MVFSKNRDCQYGSGVSWVTLATCGSSGEINCQKADQFNKGHTVEITSVQCGSVLTFIMHDGTFKDAKSSQEPKTIHLAGPMCESQGLTLSMAQA